MSPEHNAHSRPCIVIPKIRTKATLKSACLYIFILHFYNLFTNLLGFSFCITSFQVKSLRFLYTTGFFGSPELEIEKHLKETTSPILISSFVVLGAVNMIFVGLVGKLVTRPLKSVYRESR